MVKYPFTKAIARKGINFVRDIVENANSIFNEIRQENDIGIDALIEIIENEKPTNKIIAVQIKSGESYYNNRSKDCQIPVEKHYDYWMNYPLPVYGIVYVPSRDCAFWVNVKAFLKKNDNATLIRFKADELNILNSESFTKFFKPRILERLPELEYAEALRLFHSKNFDKYYLGLLVLFKKFAYKNEVWDELFDFLIERRVEDIPPILIYYLAFIPDHPDILHYKESITKEAREYGKSLLVDFKKSEILKLLEFIDEENMITRGSIGQSVEALISSIPDFSKILEEIVLDDRNKIIIRESAAAILTYHIGYKALEIIMSIPPDNSWYTYELVKLLKKYGAVDLYP